MTITKLKNMLNCTLVYAVLKAGWKPDGTNAERNKLN